MHATNPHTPDGDTDALLTSLATDPHTSLASLAARHNTTVAALTLWTTRPDIAARLATFDTLLAHRVRLIASGTLPAAIATLSTITDEFVASTRATATTHTASHRSTNAAPPDAPRAGPSTAAPPASDSSTPHLLRLRAAETARRAASTLIRLANFAPGPRRTPRPLALGAPPLATPRAHAPATTTIPPVPASQQHTPPTSPAHHALPDQPAAPSAILTLLAALAAHVPTEPDGNDATAPSPPRGTPTRSIHTPRPPAPSPERRPARSDHPDTLSLGIGRSPHPRQRCGRSLLELAGQPP